MDHASSFSSNDTTQKKRRATASRNRLGGYLFVAPLLLWLAATILYPLFSAIALSMQDIRIIGTAGDFVGLDNYARILGSESFWQAFGRSAIWVVGNAVVQTLAAFTAALILNQRFPGQQFARIWIILSWIVPTVVVVIIWRWAVEQFRRNQLPLDGDRPDCRAGRLFWGADDRCDVCSSDQRMGAGFPSWR